MLAGRAVVLLQSVTCSISLQQCKLEANNFRFALNNLPPLSVSYKYSGWNLPQGKKEPLICKTRASISFVKMPVAFFLTLWFECDYHSNFSLCKLCISFLLTYKKFSAVFSSIISVFLFSPHFLCVTLHLIDSCNLKHTEILNHVLLSHRACLFTCF